MNCLQCGAELPADGRRDQKYCGRSCSGKAYYHRGKAGLPPRPPRRHPALESENLVLAAAAIHARELGAAHDWSGETTNRCLDALVTLMDGRCPDDRGAAHGGSNAAASACVPSEARRNPLPLRPAGRRHRISDPCLDRPCHRGAAAGIRRALAPLAANPVARRRTFSPTIADHALPLLRRGQAPSRTLVHLLRPSQGGHQGRCRRGAAAVSGETGATI